MTNQEKLLCSFKERKLEDFKRLVQCRNVDVDHFYGEPDNGTLLDLVSKCRGNEDYVEVLIQNGAKLWRKDKKTGKFELHQVLKSQNPDLQLCVWRGVLYRSGEWGIIAYIVNEAIKENDIEALELLARSYSFALASFSGHTAVLIAELPRLPKEIITQLQKILFSFLKEGATDSFVRQIADIDTVTLNHAEMSYLHMACKYNRMEALDALLKKNLNLNRLFPLFHKSRPNVTPIMMAAYYGHYEIFKKLLMMPEVELESTEGNGSVFHFALQGMHDLQDGNRSTSGHPMILEALRKFYCDCTHSNRLTIENTNIYNRTALNCALKYNNEYAIKLLLDVGAKLYPKDQPVLTLTSATIIERYFDDCIQSSKIHRYYGALGGGEEVIHFRYKIFTQIDLYSIVIKRKGNYFARFESITEMRKLYKHPLTKSFLHLKWRFVRKYYYINLIFCLLFCLAVSTYIFQIQGCPSSTSANSNSSGLTDTCYASLGIWVITVLLYIVLILRELCQFSVLIRRYLGTPENWLEIIIIVMTGFLFANETNTHLAATAILTSWIGFILLLGKQPLFSIYIEMFKTVASNFAKFLLLYSILVASFAYSFFILFRNKTKGYPSPGNQTDDVNITGNSINMWQDAKMSFVKSIIMMTGEFEASTLPLDWDFNYGHVFFMLFVFLVTIVLYNLLNGLAISDTRAIMEDAEIVALISRAKLISQIERLAISNVFKSRITKRLESGYLFLRNKLFSDKIRIEEISQPVIVNPNKKNTIDLGGQYFGKMPSSIVKEAEQILEKRKQSERATKENKNSPIHVTKNNQCDSECHQSVNEQISNFKLEIDAKNAARDEKLLQNVDERFDKINKLLESVLQEVNILKNKDQFVNQIRNEMCE